jgi:hypothetical protein
VEEGIVPKDDVSLGGDFFCKRRNRKAASPTTESHCQAIDFNIVV